MLLIGVPAAVAQTLVQVDGQPLASNVHRVIEALHFLGAPLPEQTEATLRMHMANGNSAALQETLDRHVLFVVHLNPEVRVKVNRGPAQAVLQQGGYTPVLVKVENESTATPVLRIRSPQAGQRFGGMSSLSSQRLQRVERKETADPAGDTKRFLELEIFEHPPMTSRLSGLEVEYAIALIYSLESGKREATIGFDVGEKTQDLGFRGETPVLFQIKPAVETTLRIRDVGGELTSARLVFRDAAGHVFPPQAKRLAPDFYFQEQIYRHDRETVLLPPGKLEMEFSRGPEYKVLRRHVEIPEQPSAQIEIQLERWIDPMQFGFYSGDHHIHGAGCAHYTSPTEGVTPPDMFRQVKGEGLNVGCVLTWGPCYEFQRTFFSPSVHALSEPFTLIKYDLEISGFGSEALGHVCLLDLKDQTYPGSDGTKTKGWPTWTTPVMRWAKAQGGVTGYAHSASGLQIEPLAAAKRLMNDLDTNRDELLSLSEAERGLLPQPFRVVDSDGDHAVILSELVASLDRAADQLPNLAVPEMNGVGAMEICVSTAMGACDFISAMDTARVAEWNMWYHILNSGFPLKVSGETDFPCMSGDRVGQGRVYVQLGSMDRLDFSAWCQALARGRSYVSDGFAHALEFTVDGVAPGTTAVEIDGPGNVRVKAKVAFAPEMPKTVAQGAVIPPGGKRIVGDTVTLHGPRTREMLSGGTRGVEIVVNGRSVARRDVPADGSIHELEFDIPIHQSSWIALRHFPQMHTNPVNILVNGNPIRASRSSALWCIEVIRQLWRARHQRIAEHERAEAKATFDRAIEIYRAIADEALLAERMHP